MAVVSASMSPGFVSSQALMASMSFSVAPFARPDTMSVTRSFDSTAPDSFAELSSSLVPIIEVIMLAMSMLVALMVSG